MQLIRVIFGVANRFNFRPHFFHIAGESNKTADALSRFEAIRFRADSKTVSEWQPETDCKWALDACLRLAIRLVEQ